MKKYEDAYGHLPFHERPPDTRAVKAAFTNEVSSLMNELQRAADRARSKVDIYIYTINLVLLINLFSQAHVTSEIDDEVF